MAWPAKEQSMPPQKHKNFKQVLIPFQGAVKTKNEVWVCEYVNSFHSLLTTLVKTSLQVLYNKAEESWIIPS